MAPCAPYAAFEDIAGWCSAPNEENGTRVLQEATDILWGLTGRWINGICRITRRPQMMGGGCCGAGPYGDWPVFALGGRAMLSGGCGCTHHHRLPLLGPVVTSGAGVVPEVLIDGVALTWLDDFTVLDRRWLVRVDGTAWPTHQNLLLPSTEVGTFEVTWSFGEDFDAILKPATLELGRELWRQEQERAGRPTNATAASAQGESLSFDPTAPQDTTLPAVQAAVQSLNPLMQTFPPQWSSWDEPWVLHEVPVAA